MKLLHEVLTQQLLIFVETCSWSHEILSVAICLRETVSDDCKGYGEINKTHENMANLICYLIFVHSCFILFATGREMIFIYENKVMYQTFHATRTTRTFVHCLFICSLEKECVAVSYNTDTLVCQLTDVKDVNKQQEIVGYDWISAIRGTYLSIYISIYHLKIVYTSDMFT